MTSLDAALPAAGATNSAETRAERVERLVRTEAPQLLTYFVRRVDQPADAADLLGEVLLVFWRRVAEAPDDDHEVRLWLYGIASKVLSTHRRGTVRRRALADRLRADLSNASQPDPENPPVARLAAAMAQLKPADRDLIILIHQDGFSLSDVTRILRLRPGTARVRYHRARQRLKVILDGPLS